MLLVLAAANPCLAEETSFSQVKLPNAKGQLFESVLIFSDNDKAIEVRPRKKGEKVTVPYAEIDKCSYEYTDSVSAGRTHWLQVDYHDQDVPKVLVVQMRKKDYLHILDSLKAHTGIDAVVLGNANKAHR